VAGLAAGVLAGIAAGPAGAATMPAKQDDDSHAAGHDERWTARVRRAARGEERDTRRGAHPHALDTHQRVLAVITFLDARAG
jgi:hypothetical protein